MIMQNYYQRHLFHFEYPNDVLNDMAHNSFLHYGLLTPFAMALGILIISRRQTVRSPKAQAGLLQRSKMSRGRNIFIGDKALAKLFGEYIVSSRLSNPQDRFARTRRNS